MSVPNVNTGDTLTAGLWNDMAAEVGAVRTVAENATGGTVGTNWVGTSSRIQHVAKHGNDSNDGKSWITPKLTVAAAVSALPLLAVGTGSERRAGIVYVGSGEFVETACPIYINEDIRIIGVATNETTIKLGNGVNNHLLSYSPAFDGTSGAWSHHYSIRDVTLHGNRENNSGAWDVLRVYNGGFNCSLFRVFIRNACRYGMYMRRNAVNMYLYDCTFTNCTTHAIYLDLTNGANLCNFGAYGLQIDNCGAEAAIHVVSDTGGSQNIVHINGAEFEAFDDIQHNAVIKYTPMGGANGVYFSLQNINAYRNNTNGQYLIHEAAGAGAPGRWVIQNCVGRYTTGFWSDKVGEGNLSRAWTNHRGGGVIQALYGEGSNGITLGPVWIGAGTNSPEGAQNAPPGSLWMRTNGSGTTSTLYVKTSGTGNTGWTAK